MIAAGTMAGARDAGELIEDRELLIRVQGGDAGAFDVLMRRYLPRARVVARRLMQDPDDADDLVQDAFLRALDRIASFDVGRAFGPWFNRLLVNTGIDLRRRQAVRRTEAHDPETFAGKSSPAQDAERAELQQSLGKALEKLPDRQAKEGRGNPEAAPASSGAAAWRARRLSSRAATAVRLLAHYLDLSSRR